MPELDIIVLGATGYTGRLVTRYLAAHQEGVFFRFGIAGRSHDKLKALAEELNLDGGIPRIEVDITDVAQLEVFVQRAKVILNTTGPYWKLGTPVVRACARRGTHHVDLSGETAWIRDVIHNFDYMAHKSRAIIIPSCGLESIPSDICAYLSARALKLSLGQDASVHTSRTSLKIRGGISGGTIASTIVYMEEVPKEEVIAAWRPYSLSPVKGPTPPKSKFVYSLPVLRPRKFGSHFIMASHNSAIVQRTWGLHQARASRHPELAYGDQFTYDEFLAAPDRVRALLYTLGTAFVGFCITKIKPVRWLLGKMITPGSGPSDAKLEKGYMEYTNVTSSVPTNGKPQRHVKTVIKGKGDPGYLLTAIMIAEAAIALTDTTKLPDLAKEGGVLTPMAALGDVLIDRLRDTKRFEVDVELVDEDSRKTR